MSATWNSGRLPISITTRSPRPTPRARSPAARRVACGRVVTEGEDAVRRRRPSARKATSSWRSVDRAEEPGRDRVVPRAVTLSTTSRWRTADLGWKTSAEMGNTWAQFVPRRSLGHRFRACFSTPTPLGTNSRPGGRRLNTSLPRRRYRGMLPARALVAGALVTVFLAPATAGYRPGVVDHHHDDHHVDHHHHHPRPPRPRRRRPTHRRLDRTPKPDPDALRWRSPTR